MIFFNRIIIALLFLSIGTLSFARNGTKCPEVLQNTFSVRAKTLIGQEVKFLPKVDLEQTKTEFFIQRKDQTEELAGYMNFTLENGILEIDFIYVNRDLRRSGISTALIAETVKRLESLGRPVTKLKGLLTLTNLNALLEYLISELAPATSAQIHAKGSENDSRDYLRLLETTYVDCCSAKILSNRPLFLKALAQTPFYKAADQLGFSEIDPSATSIDVLDNSVLVSIGLNRTYVKTLNLAD